MAGGCSFNQLNARAILHVFYQSGYSTGASGAFYTLDFFFGGGVF